MNKITLKKFAVFARQELIRQVEMKAKAFGITPEGLPDVTEGVDYIEVNHVRYDASQKKAIHSLFQAYREKGCNQLIEEVAYTWFNRFIAIRYMEVHNYLPSRIRVLSSEIPGKVDPDILTDYHQSGLPVDINEIDQLLLEGKREEAYRKLFIAQCQELSEILPFLFEKIDDYAILLLPDKLLHSDSVINVMNRELSEEDFEHVEVIGWLYQYYISEKKDEVFAKLKKNRKVEKDEIPAATQIFTPHWIVRYMVENSLGHLWLESHPQSEIRQKMSCYVEPAEQEEEVKRKLDELRNPNLSPEKITVLDPACGSGHILVYAFDLLHSIYEEQGYPAREIPALILEKNLYGIDIDKRAAQLTGFALMMKAREKSRRIFRNPPKLNIYAIEESNGMNRAELADWLAESEEEKKQLKNLLDQFLHARNCGSILKPEPADIDRWIARVEERLAQGASSVFAGHLYEQLPRVKRLLEQAKVLSSQYDVVVTNPPYMGLRNMNPELSQYVQKHYPDSKSDLFAVFMERNHEYTKENGFSAAINQHSWMFLTSFEKLRQKLLKNETILSMIHLGPKAFEEVSGEVVQSTAYVTRKTELPQYIGRYYRLVDYAKAKEKEEAFLAGKNKYDFAQSAFGDLPGSPIAYWASDKVRKIFRENRRIGDYFVCKKGMDTGNNDRFLRFWYEVNHQSLSFGSKEAKWFPYNKGGSFRKWYGNMEYVVDWEKNGERIRTYPKSNLRNEEYYLQEGITWSTVSSSLSSFRRFPKGFLFDNGGSCLFGKPDWLDVIITFLNSKVMQFCLYLISPTLNYQPGNIASVPLIDSIFHDEHAHRLKSLARQNIQLSKEDWDSFETSWDFKKHPFLSCGKGAKNLAEAFEAWAEHAERQFHRLKANEEELNRIFIELYGLQDELTPEVPDEEVTVRKADRERDAKSFLSYCVGLIMGRYSLDVDGLAYAGGEWDPSKYRTIQPDSDGIIPLTEVAYFEDDIISWLNKILIALYGEKELAGNLQWLAESLGGIRSDESAEDRIRRYFFDEFYKDHCRIYQKRPIYWLADSGPKKGMRALIYLHRYTTHTLGTLRFRYVQELQVKLRQQENLLEQRLNDPSISVRERRAFRKELETIRERQAELERYDQKLAELVNRRIELDLDDGVAVNYQKLGDVLAPIR